ncbi:helix-hairpin-helix domain-containing protein [Actinomyces sp.]|uniref:helix-hairpin-helix domain-containing protein n=1 Tax=Actinomyces sp. TaxID=29317 RepID=UPI0026DB0C4D|nr:helix-hairpin-helix domain-containing protein [Actinomyces sp.]MDO4901246.1 helix-hairpin-helix domain-containing protein [Actinomyces sp.]
MSGKRVADRVGKRPLADFVRIACSTDPAEPVRHPRRLALAPRAAIGVGITLVALAVALALYTVLAAPNSRPNTFTATVAPDAGTPAAVVPVTDPQATVAPTDAETGGKIIVHVAGAVATPGVVTLPPGARVIDAITAADGSLPDADTDQLNLARVLSDGEQVRVPHQGEDLSAWQSEHGAGDAAGTASIGANGGGPQNTGGRININTASATELETLTGIGPALAQRIVDYRTDHGPFASVDELTNVSGIGAAKLEALRDEAAV